MSFSILPSIEELSKVLPFIHAQALSAGFHENSAWKVELAVEEALVNCFTHGQIGNGEVELSCERTEPAGLRIVLRDRGIPYAFSEPVEKSTGGHGIALIKKCMDEVIYDRVDGTNVLTLVKYAGR